MGCLLAQTHRSSNPSTFTPDAFIGPSRLSVGPTYPPDIVGSITDAWVLPADQKTPRRAEETGELSKGHEGA